MPDSRRRRPRPFNRTAVLVAAADPGLVRLGGGLASAFGERLAGAARDRLAATLHPSLAKRTAIELSTLGECAGLIGLGRLLDVSLGRVCS